MQGLKIPIIILVFIGVLGLAVFGDSVVHGKRVVTPLEDALRSQPGVVGARVDGRGANAEVFVELSEDADLIKLYPKMTSSLREYLGAEADRLHLVDSRTDFLDDAYQRMRFPIEEAIVTGQFTRMTTMVSEVASEFNLDAHEIYMDSQNVYVQLYHDGAQLYAVIARQAEAERGNRL